MRRHTTHLDGGTVTVHGHHGRPVLAFPTEKGTAAEWAEHGMVDAVAELVEAGRVKLYCVDSYDAGTWSAVDLPLEERARRHGSYERWIVDEVVPHVRAETGDAEI